MDSLFERLGQWIGQVVVIDCSSPYVVVGTLTRVGSDYLELHEADLHDLRDTETNRELYLVKTARHGVVANRSSILLRMTELVTISLLRDVATS